MDLDQLAETHDSCVIVVTVRLASPALEYRDQQPVPGCPERLKGSECPQRQYHRLQAQQYLRRCFGSHHDRYLVSEWYQPPLWACAVCRGWSHQEHIRGPLGCIFGMVAFRGPRYYL